MNCTLFCEVYSIMGKLIGLTIFFRNIRFWVISMENFSHTLSVDHSSKIWLTCPSKARVDLRALSNMCVLGFLMIVPILCKIGFKEMLIEMGGKNMEQLLFEPEKWTCAQTNDPSVTLVLASTVMQTFRYGYHFYKYWLTEVMLSCYWWVSVFLLSEKKFFRDLLFQ